MTAIYQLTDGSLEAASTGRAPETFTVTAGEAGIMPALRGHWEQNRGTTEIRAIFVERKADPPPFEGEYLDPVALGPDEYRVLAKSEAFRVLDIRRAPGAQSVEHSHRAGAAYVLTEAHISQTVPGEAPVERKVPADAVAPVPTTPRHVEKNLGATEVRAIMFELE